MQTAAAKGLIAGNFVLNRADGTSMRGLSEPEVASQLYDLYRPDSCA